MTDHCPNEATLYLQQIRDGDSQAVNRLLPLVYGDLRSLARAILGSGGANHTLQPTAMVHEAYIRLVRSPPEGFEGRVHFMRVAALAMRQLLTDYARLKGRQKRGGGAARVQLDEQMPLERTGPDGLDLIELDNALTELSELNPRMAEVVEMRFLAGMTNSEVGELLGVSERTVRLDWTMARSWLQGRLEAEAD